MSFLSPLGYSSESCGYCKDASTGRRSPKSHSGASYYVSSKGLTVGVYQGLVDRGWRRSGTILYKPDVLRHCCPHYTIRLPVESFAPARDHRQAVNRWNRYVLGDEYLKEVAKLYPKSKEDKKRQKNGFDLVTTVHESEYPNLKRPPEPAHRFEVTLEPDDFTPEKFALFKDYQKNVHHEAESEISAKGFKRFLCGSPLKRETPDVDGKTLHLGSYHQCYRLDGRLIAMSVLDLLPHCVSGVYFIYHSDFEKWSFGKLSAMREAALALEAGYKFYYMGFYIHSCVKMRYKGEYKPSYILDPETYNWDPLDGELRELFDAKPYVSLSRERRLGAAPPSAEVDEYIHPSAKEAGEAVENGLSLFDLKMPGLMTAEEVEEYPLDQQAIQVGKIPYPLTAEVLTSWETGDIRQPATIKGIIAELVACIGPDVAKETAVSFG
ncbi:arginine-tRNA-protein transferase 1 [Aaosphaeria arxii CBS 175.79]|uniref:arginyltransferase n=1 Tax=Aaosphaeria arxii CBS 175.79 TaxID=1450172 RepID=A0A6A5XU44_9PLEO|nr:arginine-tRNA-protein transferase 1 [Aaosphaeria arxii CBS 175.79]KAF2016875.1 arginine-tRNA-protein transferase 1 [Aaosphaeria arxii CBS 175.79]